MATSRAETLSNLDPRDPDFPSPWEIEYETGWNDFHANTTSLSSIERLDYDLGLLWDDPVHGERVSISEPYLVELLEHPVFKRLWNVQQFGDRWAVAGMLRSAPHSRAEHSLGAWWLLRQQMDKGTISEDRELEVAALLHDSGHPAFSHHGEAVFDESVAQDWHERQVRRILRDDHFGLNSFLDRHNLDATVVEAYFEHPLLAKNGADRLDWIYRDACAGKLIHPNVAHRALGELQVSASGTEWYFASPGAALLTQQLLEVCNTGTYMHPFMRYIKVKTAGLLRHALDAGYLVTADVAEGTDDGVMEKLWGLDVPDRTLDHFLTDLYELGMSRMMPEHMGYAMDDLLADSPRFETYDHRTTKRRVIDPFCQNPASGDPKAPRRLSYWIEDGYNPRRETPEFADVIMLIPDNPNWPMIEHHKAVIWAITEGVSIQAAIDRFSAIAPRRQNRPIS